MSTRLFFFSFILFFFSFWPLLQWNGKNVARKLKAFNFSFYFVRQRQWNALPFVVADQCRTEEQKKKNPVHAHSLHSSCWREFSAFFLTQCRMLKFHANALLFTQCTRTQMLRRCMQKRILSLRYLDVLFVFVKFFFRCSCRPAILLFCYFSHFIKYSTVGFFFSSTHFHSARESCSQPVIGIIHAKLWNKKDFICISHILPLLSLLLLLLLLLLFFVLRHFVLLTNVNGLIFMLFIRFIFQITF